MPQPTSHIATAEKPEEKARKKIDAMFSSAGWSVVPRGDYSPVISAVAIEEGLLKGGLEADYLLFLDGKAIGVLEAKPETTKLGDVVAKQAENYTHRLLDWYQYWENPLPLIYLSNGKELLFKNVKKQDDGYIPLPRMHTPAEIAEIAEIGSYFTKLPALSKAGLRNCQYEAVKALEDSFRAGFNRALIVLATGAGKTYTACLAAYRLLTYTPARRILFLVDRNNLGIQAESEFGTFRLTESGDAFNLIYTTVRLKGNKIPKDTNLAICTIQRLFSVITGTELQDSDDDESGEDDADLPEVSLEGKSHLIQHDFFDAIIVDECHRSIYGRWKKVLEYFSAARIIGLTATPAPETLSFFDNNRVVNYTLGHSIADGINVDSRTYRIKTEATTNGGVIQEGEEYRSKTKYTGEETLMVAEETVPYMASQLNRSVVNPAQIQLVLESFRDAVYRDMYPNRVPDFSSLPKTLIFAENESHAVDILRTIKEKVFPGQHPDFAQKITCKSGNTDELIRKFRNDRNFRIAVTVTLVATGTDVKPLEILLFMRDVASENLFIQMKGRGVRYIGDAQLQNVTPQPLQLDGRPISKECFFLVDAVGVTEHALLPPGEKGGEGGVGISLELLLEQITHGYLPDDNLRLLASRLPRINAKADETQRAEFLRITGVTISSLSKNIYDALENGLPDFRSSNEPNLERKALVAPLANSPEARRYLLELNAGFVKTLLPGEDTLISSGFTLEEAEETTRAFEEYLQQLRDSDEAVRIIAANSAEPITYEMLSDLARKLASCNYRFRCQTLWNDYALLRPDAVVPLKDRKEREAMTSLIQLVRFAFKSIPKLRSLTSQAAQRFELWCGQTQREFSSLSPRQREILRQIAAYVVSNGTCSRAALSQTYGLQIVAAAKSEFGSLETIDKLLVSISAFLLAA